MASGRHIDQGVAAIVATNKRTRTLLVQVDADWWDEYVANDPNGGKHFGPLGEVDLPFLVAEVLDAAIP